MVHWLFKKRSFIIGMVIVAFIFFIGIIGPSLVGDPETQVRYNEGHPKEGRLAVNEEPGEYGILGTDQNAQDYLTNVVVGVRNSLRVGVIVAIVTIIMATLVGGVGAYLGGWIDEIAQLITNIVLVFPVLPALLVLSASLEQRSLDLIILIISLISWPWAARAIRSQVLSLKERDFVSLSKVSGSPSVKIAVLDVLPHILSYIALVFAITLGAAILTEAGISVVGLGPENTVTLGILLERALAFESIRLGYWWIFVTPGILLTAFMFSIYLIQSNMDAVFNPRLREE
ncbi:MAG: ABC transporter permease [Candidatus Kariarchaeaceae archaeon]|jgi:peptide/nickel transport system permease protein